MKAELSQLIALQNADTNIRRLQAEIESIPERRAEIEKEFDQRASEIRALEMRRDRERRVHQHDAWPHDDDVEVTVSGNMLTIRGSREQQHEEKNRDFLQREISYEEMERSIMLPPGTSGEGIKASFKNGMLELTIPIPKELSTKKVQLQIENGGNGAKREEAKQHK